LSSFSLCLPAFPV